MSTLLVGRWRNADASMVLDIWTSAQSLDTLGEMFREQGTSVAANSAYRRAVAIRRYILGAEDHAEVQGVA